MTAFVVEPPRRLRRVSTEACTLAAFVRRDFLVAWSYRMSFVSDLGSLLALTLMFHFIGAMVDESRLPTYQGTHVTYLEFAVVGLALGLFMQLGLERVAQAVRSEQLMGTLESLLLTPARVGMIQVGSAVVDLLYVPLRTSVFLLAVSLSFGLHLEPSGILPAFAVLAAFVPFVWGLGVAGAAVILTFRRGGGLLMTVSLALALVSGVYFPVDTLPGWLSGIASANPVGLAIESIRDALLGGAGWNDLLPTLAVLSAMAVVSLVVGAVAFRAALRRERRLGTIGLY
jgi:ABC-2 type transport system permease protein